MLTSLLSTGKPAADEATNDDRDTLSCQENRSGRQRDIALGGRRSRRGSLGGSSASIAPGQGSRGTSTRPLAWLDDELPHHAAILMLMDVAVEHVRAGGIGVIPKGDKDAYLLVGRDVDGVFPPGQRGWRRLAGVLDDLELVAMDMEVVGCIALVSHFPELDCVERCPDVDAIDAHFLAVDGTLAAEFEGARSHRRALVDPFDGYEALGKRW